MSANQVFQTNALLDKISQFQDGDIIGIDSGENPDRKFGIGHVAVVTENDGKLYLAESSRTKGVVVRPLEQGLKILESSAKKSGKKEPMFIGRGIPR